MKAFAYGSYPKLRTTLPAEQWDDAWVGKWGAWLADERAATMVELRDGRMADWWGFEKVDMRVA